MIRIIRPSIRTGLRSVISQSIKELSDIREYPIKPAQHLDLSNNPEIFFRRNYPCEFGQGKADAAFWDAL